MRFKIDFSYDGSSFSGYQKQPGKRTVQSEIELLLSSIDESNVKLIAAGRTDKGVNALHQIAHFDFHKEITAYKLKGALNGRLKGDIYINDVELVDDSFHARFNVKSKVYEYYISTNLYNPILRNNIYQYCKKLNIKNMIDASKYLLGTNDYSSFVASDEVREDKVRTIYDICIKEEAGIITFTFHGDGFLKYQIRNMVGLLIDVGKEKIKPEKVKDILLSKDRKLVGKIAPAEGLTLIKINY